MAITIYSFDPDVVKGASYAQQPSLTLVDAMKLFRASTDPYMSLYLVKNIVEYNLSKCSKYHAHQVGNLIHAWWCQNAVA